MASSKRTSPNSARGADSPAPASDRKALYIGAAIFAFALIVRLLYLWESADSCCTGPSVTTPT